MVCIRLWKKTTKISLRFTSNLWPDVLLPESNEKPKSSFEDSWTKLLLNSLNWGPSGTLSYGVSLTENCFEVKIGNCNFCLTNGFRPVFLLLWGRWCSSNWGRLIDLTLQLILRTLARRLCGTDYKYYALIKPFNAI